MLRKLFAPFRKALETRRQEQADAQAYRKLLGSLAKVFEAHHDLPRQDAVASAKELLTSVNGYLVRHSIHWNAKDWAHFFTAPPSDLLLLKNQFNELQELERSRLNKVDWAEVPHVEYHIRMGSLDNISGGDTADLLHISTHALNDAGRKVS
ncbi:MAG TPA: hypothetical protein VI874_04530, partial [Candidatus Norongarragalinales archaeon]|nr:hypothetical protein [Candidatus Norongarragalinales archaeon]